MTNEEMERAMQFILEQQAQTAASQQRHEEFLQRHEEALQKHEETIRRIEAMQEVASQQITHLSSALLELAGAQARAEARAEASAAETNDKINTLIASQMKADERIAASERRLTEVTAASERRLAELAAGTGERFAALAQSQADSNRRLDRLADTVDRYINERREGRPDGEKA